MNFLDALIFIDTNIFLDFYRIRNDVSVSYLESIDKHHDRIITGSQIEMEYKKNRQKVILDSIDSIKTPNWNALTPPAILTDAQPVKVIQKKKEEINQQQKILKQRIIDILKNPASNDIVYKTLQRLFKNDSPYNLNRENKRRFTIRNLARKRFVLGYPPRKKDDNSIGDAVNWEWIIQCAIDSGKHIILVTRDTDYGLKYSNELFLNDWLLQEFKQRVSTRRKIILTDRLSVAFKMISLAVTKEMEEEEEKLIVSDQEENVL
ncbi:hypothetical protein A6770_37190 [Nostoc minutum NIES-26]|uniref:DUF4935 domain-containing protein n=1 Tax=Nostoc minutum NIES-26 TaxID=1844469 RepID=A0A367RYR2_9NOSO|nr:hypothetical protein A6770_37190 [Nostoc minutum NIES-26]